MTNKEYLEAQLKSRQSELRELEANHRIKEAVYNTKSDMLRRDILTIERQLEKGEDINNESN